MRSRTGLLGRSGLLPLLLAIFIVTSAPAAAATIVALGASNTFGKGVARNQAYPAQLEAILRAKGANIRVSRGVEEAADIFIGGRLGEDGRLADKTMSAVHIHEMLDVRALSDNFSHCAYFYHLVT